MTNGNGHPLTCASCKWWHKMPTSPLALGLADSGQCRGGPPQIMLLPNGGQFIGYVPVPAEFPACALHVKRVEVSSS